MRNNEIERFVAMHYWVGLVLTAVCFWDIFALKVSTVNFYYPFKIITISIYFIVAYLGSKKKISVVVGYNISCTVFYIYSYIGTNYLHSTYLFSFYEAFVFLCFLYTGPLLHYSLFTIFGLVLATLSIHYMPEPDFMKEGHSIRPHLQILTAIFGVLTFVMYWFFNRQREIIFKLDQKFVSIGRQSAFLLHELKSPLARFMIKSSASDRKDAEYIYSIVEGVELLITNKENIQFMNFNWPEVKLYLEEEFRDTCEHYKIHFEIVGFEGVGHGHKSTFKLALKNLIKNAVESIAFESKGGTIRVSKNDNVIEVSNNGSVITEEKIEQLFTPFYSEKKSKNNYGIGLHFVETVVKAHNGKIGVRIENEWNIFSIKLGDV